MKRFVLLLVVSLYSVKGTSLASKYPLGGRIIGGETARINEFPYVASVRRYTDSGIYFCGGSLINEQWVLTAGSCVVDAILFSIRLGTIYSDSSDPSSVLVSTDDFEQHPEYDGDTRLGDVGIIRLREPLQFSDFLKPVDYLEYDDLISGLSVVALGWGATSDSDISLSQTLKFVEVQTLNSEDCKLVYGEIITEAMVCVEGNYNQGACAGDIGGPLILHVQGAAIQVGVSSFISARGCESTDPSGYTKTAAYIGWIRNQTSNVSWRHSHLI